MPTLQPQFSILPPLWRCSMPMLHSPLPRLLTLLLLLHRLRQMMLTQLPIISTRRLPLHYQTQT